jgi:hypothetical protein
MRLYDSERTTLKQSKDTHILIKRKNLNQLHENLARTSFENWISASKRARKLRLDGYDVSIPPPRVGRPQLLLISRREHIS